MDSFKETGGIEYSASVILGLQPRNIRQPKFNYEQEMSKEIREQEIVFLKQRYGISGMKANVSVDFHAAKDLYTEKGAFGKNQLKMFHVKQKRIRKYGECKCFTEKERECFRKHNIAGCKSQCRFTEKYRNTSPGSRTPTNSKCKSGISG